MTVSITLMAPNSLTFAADDLRYLATGRCRKTEEIAVGGNSNNQALDGEIAIIMHNEASWIRGAHGTAPDATVATATAGTTSWYRIPPNQPYPVAMRAGELFDFRT